MYERDDKQNINSFSEMFEIQIIGRSFYESNVFL